MGKVGIDMKKKKTGIVIAIVVAIIVIISVLILLPFIVNSIYYKVEPKFDFFNVLLEPGDILGYYAQLMSLIATIILGAIAVVQTYKSQKKSDEINKLQLQIAQRELAVVEKQYAESNNKNEAFAPKFEVKIMGYSGCYQNINLEIKNVSDTIISGFRFLAFTVSRDDTLIENILRWKIRFQSLNTGEAQSLSVATPHMCDQNGNWTDVKLEWKFSCDDVRGVQHFYSASAHIDDAGQFNGDFWEVTKIG